MCPGCNQVFHETTEHYDPDKPPNPAMCRLKEPFLSWGWEDFSNDPGLGVGDMECPGCGCLYAAPGGQLIVQEQEGGQDDSGEETCPKCGKAKSQFKSSSGFVNHCRMCKGR